MRDRFAEPATVFVDLAADTYEEAASIAPGEIDLAALARLIRDQAAWPDLDELQQRGQELQRVRLPSLREGVDRCRCIILLGDPGSGKTTALNYLAYELARENLERDKPLLPLPLRLSEFGPGQSVETFIERGWGSSLQSNHWAAPELTANLDGYLEEGRLFILFDALNEMSAQGYAERAAALRSFIDHWQERGNRFLVTCRVLDYGEELAGLQRIEVQPFEDEQIKGLLQKVLGSLWERMWEAMTDGNDEDHQLLKMARNPYVLSMMITEFARRGGRLSRNRAELMTGFTQHLWARAKAKCPPERWLSPAVQQAALAQTAFEMQRLSGFGTVVETDLVKTVMPIEVKTDPRWPPRPSPPDQVLTLAAEANIIELPADRSSVRFYHQLLQEYFAAREMLKRDPAGLDDLWRWSWLEKDMPLWVRPRGNRDPLPPPPPTGWEETTILAAGLAPDNDDQLVRALIRINPVLAGRCLHEGRARVDRAIRERVIEALLKTIAQAEVALRVRIAAGEVLGYLGDPRIGKLVEVPAGECLMGDDKGEYKDEKPQHTIELPTYQSYQFGKYPLTNAEYARFIEAGGYQERRWWTEAGWKWKEGRNRTESRYWGDSRYNKPNQPANGISWYECVAYCHWLSVESERLYRLPTEAEWEKGARGTDGREYPWGNRFEAGRLNANVGEQVVKATTPVGIYPTGVSPYGAYDCAGNVWEWCATRREDSYMPYPYDTSEDEWTTAYLEGNRERVLRGGSWRDQAYFARCAARIANGPDASFDASIGVRVVVLPHL